MKRRADRQTDGSGHKQRLEEKTTKDDGVNSRSSIEQGFM